jgi:hypothetical protein
MKDRDSAKGVIGTIPFDAGKLDRLMEEAGIDILLATSKHNVQYLLGAERAIFFDYMDALGVSRYLPVKRGDAAHRDSRQPDHCREVGRGFHFYPQ